MSDTEFYSTTVPRADTDFTVPKRYSELKMIGRGAQGIVCSALDTQYGVKVAIKKFMKPFQTQIHAKRAFREIKLMQLLRHRNIISLLNLFTPSESIDGFTDMYVVMDLMDANLCRVVNTQLDHERVSYLLYQVLCAIRYMHSAGIIHRDLKPSNIVVKEDCSLKILDFGLARNVGNFMMTPYVVTRYYRAPEVILGMPYDQKVDVWACGCILYQLYTGRVFFPGSDHIDQWHQITSVLGTPDDTFIDRLMDTVKTYIRSKPRVHRPTWEELVPDHLFPSGGPNDAQRTREGRDLMSRMLEIDPLKRLTIDQCLQHPYVRCWYRQEEASVNCPETYNHGIDEVELNPEQWKELIFSEVTEFQQKFPTGHTPV
ncbi:hypothetical protein ACHWQZ_G004881 [Mnemiopsis leidyi]